MMERKRLQEEPTEDTIHRPSKKTKTTIQTRHTSLSQLSLSDMEELDDLGTRLGSLAPKNAPSKIFGDDSSDNGK